jgi:hypothetical protein
MVQCGPELLGIAIVFAGAQCLFSHPHNPAKDTPQWGISHQGLQRADYKDSGSKPVRNRDPRLPGGD